MSLFAIADLHLSLGTDKPMDIFGGWSDYVTKLETNWQNKVRPEDTVVIPGDISWGMNFEQSKKDFEFINKLNGRKIISKGNHDYWWNTKNKMDKFFAENGFDTINILHNNHYSYEGYGICGTRGWISDNGEPADQKRSRRKRQTCTRRVCACRRLSLWCFCIIRRFSAIAAIMICLKCFKHGHVRFYGHLHGRAHAYAINGTRD